jgi:hypothetical protein
VVGKIKELKELFELVDQRGWVEEILLVLLIHFLVEELVILLLVEFLIKTKKKNLCHINWKKTKKNYLVVVVVVIVIVVKSMK